MKNYFWLSKRYPSIRNYKWQAIKCSCHKKLGWKSFLDTSLPSSSLWLSAAGKYKIWVLLSSCQQSSTKCGRWREGPFTNYVEKILAFFDHLPPCVDIFYGINVVKKSGHFWTTYLPRLVNVVCECPLTSSREKLLGLPRPLARIKTLYAALIFWETFTVLSEREVCRCLSKREVGIAYWF